MDTPIADSPVGMWVAEQAWPAVETALEQGATAVLPVGAASKEHGRHLPMNTDYLQAEWLAVRLIEQAFVVVWPTLGYGHYPAFVDYPGSCSLSEATFQAVIAEVLKGMLRFSPSRLILVNTGISTIPAIEAAIACVSPPGHTRLVNVYAGPRFERAAALLQEQPRGGHADELETSIMLSIAADRVAMDQAKSCVRQMGPGPFNRTDPQAPNYTPSGVYGDARLASREKGELLTAAMLEDVLAIVNP